MSRQDHLEGIEEKSDLESAARKVLESLDLGHLKDRLTGRSGGLRPSKPTASGDTGLTQYVWRMARFHSGDDPKMPVTASWDLQNWLDSQGIDASVSGITDTAGKQITSILDTVSQILVAAFDRNPNAGLDRWQKAIYG